MGFLSGLFHSRDKPTNSTNGSAYHFLFGGSNSDKAVNERSAMQMTAVYACVRILSSPLQDCQSIFISISIIPVPFRIGKDKISITIISIVIISIVTSKK